MSDHMFGLMQKHQQIDERMRAELSRVRPDALQVMRLKRLKLVLKDRIARRMARAG